MLQRQNINNQINQRFTPATDLKIGTFVLLPNFQTQKGISKKLQPLRKGPYQIIAKTTEVTYKLIDTTKKKKLFNTETILTLLSKRIRFTRINPTIFFHRFKSHPKKQPNRARKK